MSVGGTEHPTTMYCKATRRRGQLNGVDVNREATRDLGEAPEAGGFCRI